MKKNTRAPHLTTSLSLRGKTPKTQTHTQATTPNPQQQLPLNEFLTRAHYTMAYQRVSAGKAPGPDTIPNEVIKFLPKKVHDVIYSLFTIMAKHSYTSQKWYTSATKLIYKPKKTDPNNPTNYRPIALMNCILKLWTSILTNIGTQIAESEGIFSDTTDGFRSHRNMYDNISTHITIYEDAKISQQTSTPHTQTSNAHSEGWTTASCSKY